MKIKLTVLTFILFASQIMVQADTTNESSFIGKNTSILKSDLMTPEALWAMGRLGNYTITPDSRSAVYGVTYYSVAQNKSHSVIYSMDIVQKTSKLLTTSNDNENGGVFVEGGKKIVFLSNQSGSSQLWIMNADGSERKQISKEENDIEDFLISPDEKKIIFIQEIDDYSSIEKKYDDLPKASGMVINDLMYKHWDHFVTSIPHPFVADFSGNKISNAKDILNGEPYECPIQPFGGIEQLCWSKDSKTIAYTCRKMTGKKYAGSTDSDIFLYDLSSGSTKNICKPDGYQRPVTDDLHSYENQTVNKNEKDCNMGYDTNPQYSPDGKYIAWLSMERDGYESDRNRLCVYELSSRKKIYVTEKFESGVDSYCWGKDSKSLYFSGVWHGTSMIYNTDLKGQINKITDGVYDYSIVQLTADGKDLIVKRQSMSQADEIYAINLKGKNVVSQLTQENKYFYDNLTMGKVDEHWVETVDGKKEQCWIIYPPHFDPHKKYPTLLYCEGGPQSPISQFWSFRWNFQIMASHGYIIVAPNRRGLPGYGMDWLQEISGDYTGLCMKDYLSAIDDFAKEPFVDKDRLGCVGASFGGYSVYWLAGHHEKRFKCFIAHDGIFNTQQQYMETEEMWFPNWDLSGAPWVNNNAQTLKVYKDSPHESVDKWDTPILCIHGMKDYRILSSQAQSAFDAAKMRGIDAQLLLYPDENHWVLKPQNGILWQRTFFNWLDKWLKK